MLRRAFPPCFAGLIFSLNVYTLFLRILLFFLPCGGFLRTERGTERIFFRPKFWNGFPVPFRSMERNGAERKGRSVRRNPPQGKKNKRIRKNNAKMFKETKIENQQDKTETPYAALATEAPSSLAECASMTPDATKYTTRDCTSGSNLFAAELRS